MKTLILALPAPDEAPGGGSANPPVGGGIWPLIIGLIVVMVLMPMLTGKKDKQRRLRIKDLKKHDQVVTTGGIYGTVMSFDEATVTLEVAKDVRLRFKRSSVFDIENPGDAAKSAAESERKAGVKG